MERHADAEAGGHVVDHADEEVGQHQTHPLPVMLDRDACSSIRLILRKLFILTYLIGTFGLAFPNLAVKTKPWAATKRNEENVTRWPMPGSCLRDHSCLTPALGKDSNCWRLTHLIMLSRINTLAAHEERVNSTVVRTVILGICSLTISHCLV